MWHSGGLKKQFCKTSISPLRCFVSYLIVECYINYTLNCQVHICWYSIYRLSFDYWYIVADLLADCLQTVG